MNRSGRSPGPLDGVHGGQRGRPEAAAENRSGRSPGPLDGVHGGQRGRPEAAAVHLAPRRRDEAKALFRNAILDAAEVVFAERGFHGARIQDIAERARIAVGTVYNHFAQKDDVLSALLEERTYAMLAAFGAAPDAPEVEHAPGTFQERLVARMTRMFAYIDQHRAFFAIANELGFFSGKAAPGARSSERNLQHTQAFRGALRAIVEEGIASGDLEPLDVDAVARFLGGTIRAFILSSIESVDKTPAHVEDHAKMTIDLFLHGASPRRRKRSKP